MLQRSGKVLSTSKIEPHFSSWIFSISSTKITVCGLPIDTVSPVKSKVSAVSLTVPRKSRGRPILTQTRPSGKTDGFTIPLLVCRENSIASLNPRLRINFATQRVALPHMAASEPSALKMRISNSLLATFTGVTTTTPSPPMPNRLSQRSMTRFSRASPGVISNDSPGSTNTKSLPRPVHFENFNDILYNPFCVPIAKTVPLLHFLSKRHF